MKKSQKKKSTAARKKGLLKKKVADRHLKKLQGGRQIDWFNETEKALFLGKRSVDQ